MRGTGNGQSDRNEINQRERGAEGEGRIWRILCLLKPSQSNIYNTYTLIIMFPRNIEILIKWSLIIGISAIRCFFLVFLVDSMLRVKICSTVRRGWRILCCLNLCKPSIPDTQIKFYTTEIIHTVLPEKGGTGGLVALDSQGNISMPFNTEGMYRAWVQADGNIHVKIYKD